MGFVCCLRWLTSGRKPSTTMTSVTKVSEDIITEVTLAIHYIALAYFILMKKPRK